MATTKASVDTDLHRGLRLEHMLMDTANAGWVLLRTVALGPPGCNDVPSNS